MVMGRLLGDSLTIGRNGYRRSIFIGLNFALVAEQFYKGEVGRYTPLLILPQGQ